MAADEERASRWRAVWEERRRLCLAGVGGLRASLPPEALAILDEALALAAREDPTEHAEANVDDLVARVNALPGQAPLLLHRPVCNALTALRIAAQEVVAARAGEAPLAALPSRRPPLPPRRTPSDFAWFLVAGEDGELVELVEECRRDLGGSQPVLRAATLEEARRVLREPRDGAALVVANLTLASAGGPGPHGLAVTSEARRRHHAVLLVTAAADYLHYWQHLPEVGLTGHDVIVKTRWDFADRLRARIAAIARPPQAPISYEEDTGHVVWIGGVEVADLESQETLVLRALDGTWRTAQAIADACWDTDLQPKPASVPPLISTLRRKLTAALVRADSPYAQRELISSRRRDGLPAQYRLASWLGWVEPPEPAGAAFALPPVLVVEDDPDWADWVVSCLRELRWPASVVTTDAEARAALEGDETPILVVDLGLPDLATGLPDHEVGLRLVEDLADRRHDVRVIVLSAYGDRDSLRSRLFESGVRTVDVLHKAADRDERRAVLLASLHRAVDEMARGVARPRDAAANEALAVHYLVRVDRRTIEVDGRRIRLSAGEAAVVDVLIDRPNVPVKAELLEDRCYPRPGRGGVDSSPMNKVHQTVKRLRQKIDRELGAAGAGMSVLRTPHRGARTTYELYGLVVDPARTRP
jgi:DNA-binding response OmpR family regulator